MDHTSLRRLVRFARWAAAFPAGLIAGSAAIAAAWGAMLATESWMMLLWGSGLCVALIAIVAGLVAPAAAVRTALVSAITGGVLLLAAIEVFTILVLGLDDAPLRVAIRCGSQGAMFLPFIVAGGFAGRQIVRDIERGRARHGWNPAPFV